MLDLGHVAAVVLLILLVITVGVWLKTRSQLGEIQKERDQIVGEEMRMFDFLHHIGQAIEKDITPAQLYKEIVEGFEPDPNASTVPPKQGGGRQRRGGGRPSNNRQGSAGGGNRSNHNRRR